MVWTREQERKHPRTTSHRDSLNRNTRGKIGSIAMTPTLIEWNSKEVNVKVEGGRRERERERERERGWAYFFHHSEKLIGGCLAVLAHSSSCIDRERKIHHIYTLYIYTHQCRH